MANPLPVQGTSKKIKSVVANGKKKNTSAVQALMATKSKATDITKEPPSDLPKDFYREGNLVKALNEGDPGYYISEALGEAPAYVFNPPPMHVQDRELYKKENLANIRILSGIDQTNLVPPMVKFFLTGVDAPRSEKYQIIDTFGDWYIFFYGEQPTTYTFHGTLLNVLNHNWLNEFDYYYDSFMRGTMATRNVTRTFITYGFQQIQGHVLNFSHSIRADSDRAVNFSMQVAVVKRYSLSTDDGNRITDSFILNKETINAFQSNVKDNNGSKFNYSMLRLILNNKVNPSTVVTDQTKAERDAIVQNIKKLGLTPYART